jgi:hypothetical protein
VKSYEMVERGEIPQERKREWLTGHTARLLGLCGGFSIMNNSLAIETDDGDRIIDLTKLTDFVATEGWGAFIKKVEESRECLRTA